jgi:hypothetical protein
VRGRRVKSRERSEQPQIGAQRRRGLYRPCLLAQQAQIILLAIAERLNEQIAMDVRLERKQIGMWLGVARTPRADDLRHGR